MRLRIAHLSVLILCCSAVTQLPAQSLADTVAAQRESLVMQLRELRPMVYNFPCREFPKCAENKKPAELERVSVYEDAKRTFQAGLLLIYEGNTLAAYTKLVESQRRLDKLLESLSQSYLERAGEMLQSAVEKRDPNDAEDLSLADIIIEFGPRSTLRDDMAAARLPHNRRTYDPRMFKYVLHRESIGRGIAEGYESLGLAREVRQRALSVHQGDPAKGELPARLLPERIRLYLASVRASRKAKRNAAIVFKLKYPYQNYALSNPTGRREAGGGKQGEAAEIGGVRMKWGLHPYVSLDRLHPAFDLRVPEAYRADTVDLNKRIYSEELERFVRLGVNPEQAKELMLEGGKGGKSQP